MLHASTALIATGAFAAGVLASFLAGFFVVLLEKWGFFEEVKANEEAAAKAKAERDELAKAVVEEIRKQAEEAKRNQRFMEGPP
jgi:hypothetical protein